MSSNIEKHMCKMLKVESIINHKQLDEGIRTVIVPNSLL